MTMPVSLKEYFAAAGSPFTKADAEVIGPQVEALAEQGEITERSLVDTAQSANSPLHRFYEWDDAVAGDRFRLIQAGQMMRSIKVRTVVDDRPKVTSVYKLVAKGPSPAPERKGYNALHERSAFAAKMTGAAYDDIMAWKARYAPYLSVWMDFASTFREVTNQISELQDAGRPTRMDEETDAAVAALRAWRDQFENIVENWSEVADQGRFMVEAIDQLVAVGAAQAAGQDRACLRCGTAFPSAGIHNRLCRRCAAL